MKIIKLKSLLNEEEFTERDRSNLVHKYYDTDKPESAQWKKLMNDPIWKKMGKFDRNKVARQWENSVRQDFY